MENFPQSIKTLRKIRSKQSKLIEGPKKTLFVRGSKSSNLVINLMKDIKALRRERSILYSKKHQLHPFQSKEQIQNYSQKNDCSLFVFGSHSKKRPHNVVIGRTYEGKILDMVEFGIIDLKTIFDIVDSCEIPNNSRPFIIFQGDLWETDQTFMKLRNLLNDFFFENNKVEGIQIDKVLKVVVCITALENKHIFIKVYEVNVEGTNILEDEGKLIIQQLGPNVQLVVRRHFFAQPQLFKQATHVPKIRKKKINKNIKYDSLGNKKGKLYVDRQNLNAVPTRRRKLIKKDQKEARVPKTHQQKNEDQFAN